MADVSMINRLDFELDDEQSDEAEAFIPKAVKNSRVWKIITSIRTLVIAILSLLFFVFICVLVLWSCSFFIALKKLANDLQDASISYVLATVQQQINSQEGFIESIHLAIEHNPAILSNRTLFQEYSQQAYISSIRYQALIDNIQIVDYLNPSIVSFTRAENTTNQQFTRYTSIDSAPEYSGNLDYFSDETFTSVIGSETYEYDFLNSSWCKNAFNMSTEGYARLRWVPPFPNDGDEYPQRNMSIFGPIIVGYGPNGNIRYHVVAQMTSDMFYESLNHVIGSRASGFAIVYEAKTENILGITDERYTNTIVNGRPLNLKDLKVREMKTLVSNIRSIVKKHKVVNGTIVQTSYFDAPKGAEYLVGVTRIVREGNIDWVVVHAINRSKLAYGSIVTFVVSALVHCLVIIFGFSICVYLTFYFSAPLKQIQKELIKVEMMKLDAVNELDESQISEIYAIQQAFLLTVEKLKEYRTFIPAHLLDELDGVNRKFFEKKDKDNDGISVAPSSQGISNRHMSQTASSNSSTMRLRKGSIFRLGVIERPVTVVCVHISNILEVLKHVTVDHWTLNVHKSIVEGFQKINSSYRGNFKFEPERFEFVFNSSGDILKHQEKACQIAVKLDEYLKSFNNKHELPCKLDYRVIVMTGNAFCGNIGSETNRKFITWEPDLNQKLAFMITVAEEWEANIIVDHETFVKTNSGTIFLHRPLCDISNPVLHKVQRYYELGSKIDKKGDEWMYEMQELELSSKWKIYNSAYEDFVKKDYDSAILQYEDYLKEHPDDLIAMKQIDVCKQKIEMEE